MDIRQLLSHSSRVADAGGDVDSDHERDWRQYFESMLAEFGVDSPVDIPEDKRDDFFLKLDQGWNSRKEEGEDGPEQVVAAPKERELDRDRKIGKGVGMIVERLSEMAEDLAPLDDENPEEWYEQGKEIVCRILKAEPMY